MKSLIQLHTSVAEDLGDLLDIDPTRDILTMIKRCAHEGDSFLTITLPSFEAAFLRCLSLGHIDLTLFPSFGSRGRLPAFLWGFVGRVFDEHGVLRSDPDPACIQAVRQLCVLSKKIERPVSDKRSRAAIEAYVGTDESLPAEVPQDLSLAFRGKAERLFRDVLDRLETAIANFDLIPRHGPGAVAEGFSPKQKWKFCDWYESIDHVFPANLYTSYDVNTGFRTGVAPEDERPVRVITVPKTMKAPRIIAIEPSARQYVQQAVSRFLYKELASRYPAQLDLFDQGTNRAWAEIGSIDGSIATLDLSEASDRVAYWLVKLLVGNRPHVLDALEACRSREAELPDGRVIALRKFASMGSALTFPIQSMVFFTIIALGCDEAGLSTKSFLDRSAVFGDDLIVPSEASAAVMALLEDFGLRVNHGKSFTEGYFRESCGEEYYRGHDVSVVKLKSDFPARRRDAQKVGSLSVFRNELYQRGLWKTCRMVDELLGQLVRYRAAPVGTPAICRWTFLSVAADRVSPSLQRDEMRLPHLCPKAKEYKVDGPEGLLKYFLESTHNGDSQRGSGKWDPSERPVAFTIYDRWTPVHTGR